MCACVSVQVSVLVFVSLHVSTCVSTCPDIHIERSRHEAHTIRPKSSRNGTGARGGGLGSSTIFQEFNEPYAPSYMVLNDGA